jgi:phosphate-selective porin OprO/OprP
VTWTGGVFNDWIDADESFSDNSNQAVGRVSWLPMVSDNDNNLFHLAAAVRYDDAKNGLRYKATPEVRDAPFFVDTGSFDANSSTIINLEASWRKGPVWIMAEYTDNNIDAPALGNPRFSGYHILTAWSVTGEVRPYIRRSGVFGQLPVTNDIDHGGFGAIELALRWSDIDLSDGALDGGEMQIAKAAATWWFRPSTNVSLNYQRIWNEIGITNGEASGFVLRIMLSTR